MDSEYILKVGLTSHADGGKRARKERRMTNSMVWRGPEHLREETTQGDLDQKLVYGSVMFAMLELTGGDFEFGPGGKVRTGDRRVGIISI